MEDKIILVDIFDNEIGTSDKLSAHTKPTLHRAFSVFLYNDNKILLHKRALNKYHSGGLWTNSCCSHPRANLSFIDSVNNRLNEELGITEKIDLKEIYDFTYLTKFSETMFEYEHDHVLVGKYNGIINANKEEICDLMWIDIPTLENELLNNPQKFTSWFIICAPKVINYLKNI